MKRPKDSPEVRLRRAVHQGRNRVLTAHANQLLLAGLLAGVLLAPLYGVPVRGFVLFDWFFFLRPFLYGTFLNAILRHWAMNQWVRGRRLRSGARGPLVAFYALCIVMADWVATGAVSSGIVMAGVPRWDHLWRSLWFVIPWCIASWAAWEAMSRLRRARQSHNRG